MRIYLWSIPIYLKAAKFQPMASKKKGKPGPKKGVPKPHARPFVPGFNDRLRQAMARASLLYPNGKTRNSALAAKVGCSGAVIGQLLHPEKPRTTIDTVLLLHLCDALSVTPYYLALDQGGIEDVPLNSRPFQEARTKNANPRRIEKTHDEVNS